MAVDLLVKFSGLGVDFFEFLPEFGAVVFDFGMNQFMNQNQVSQLIRQEGKFDIEADIIFGRAAAPAGFLVTYGQSVIAEAMFLGQFLKTRSNFPCGLINIKSFDFFGKLIGLILNFFETDELFLDPVLFA